MKSSCFKIHLIWVKGEGKTGKNYINYSLFYPIELNKKLNIFNDLDLNTVKKMQFRL